MSSVKREWWHLELERVIWGGYIAGDNGFMESTKTQGDSGHPYGASTELKWIGSTILVTTAAEINI